MRHRSLRPGLFTGALCVLVPALLSATIEEQRARLPPPATCQDPVEGTWRAQRYDTRYNDWAIFTLTLRRASSASAQLRGTIGMEFWSGTRQEANPPPCRPGLRHYLVDQEATGAAGPGGRVSFDANTVRLRQELCPHSFRGYNRDHFSGVIDPAIQEFQSVNNDGGRDLNEPLVFRRVGCFDALARPHAAVVPPPIAPPRRRAGCGR